MTPRRFGFALAAVALLFAGIAGAGTLFGGSGFSPQVPVSAFARPASWLDPQRLHLTSSVSVGSGFGGTQALQVTSLSYQFSAPLTLGVSVGNAWGSNTPGRSGSPFLEGLDVSYRPFSSMMVRFQYRDIRSPLQFSADSPYGLWGR
jgi:hypothetical protein